MFWFIELPMLATSLILAVAVILATFAAPRFRWRRGRVLSWGMLLAMVAFVPSCTVVMTAANAVQLGVARYENTDAIWGERFKRWLPEEATDIVVRKRVQGYEARFKIDRKSLDAWFDRCWANAREKAEPRTEPALDDSFNPTEIEQGFGELGDARPRSGQWIMYEGPRRLNWAGATTWFDEESGVAYQDVGFW
jgi:hypothetical protein